MNSHISRYSVLLLIAVVSVGFTARPSQGAVMAKGVYMAYGTVLSIDETEGRLQLLKAKRPAGKRLPLETLWQQSQPAPTETGNPQFYFKSLKSMEKLLKQEKVEMLTTVEVYYRMRDGRKVIVNIKRSK